MVARPPLSPSAVLACAAACLAALAAGGCGAATPRGEPGRPGPARRLPATPPGPLRAGCAARPSVCGYPDRTDTGVPAGTRLTPSGSITVTQDGAVIAGLDVAGMITVQASGVTIRDTRVTAAGGRGIYLTASSRNTVIEDTTVRGSDRAAGALDDGILNAGAAGGRGLRLQVTGCAGTDWNGPGVVTDSYMSTDAYRAGAHTEPIYYGGGAQRSLTVEHDTLLNPFAQTAVVFGGTDYGPQRDLTIDGNLLAGGGYVVYGGGNNAATARVRVTNNRIAELYFARGGYFGVGAYLNSQATDWRGNYWDATLRPAHA